MPKGGAAAQPTSIQNIFKEMGFDPDEPLDHRGASPPKGAGGVATRSATKGEPGQPDEPKGGILVSTRSPNSPRSGRRQHEGHSQHRLLAKPAWSYGWWTPAAAAT